MVLVAPGLDDAASLGLDLQSAVERADDAGRLLPPVSYTHLTLPTSDLV